MKLPIASSIVALAIGIMSYAFAGPAPASSGPSPGGLALPGTNSSETGSPSASSAATPNENNTDESDDTLYRGKTGESENPMLRDEGPLHFKTRPKEKVQEVDSLKKLPSSGLDPKFQGTLLNSYLNAIAKISGKENENREETVQRDQRFKTPRLT